MDKGDVLQNIKKHFVDFKERQHDMHNLFMNRYAHMQTKEMQEVNITRKFMNVNNQNNKTTKPKQQFFKQLGSTNNEQSNSSTVNGTFANGSTDMMQASQKRTFDQFAGSSNEDSVSKMPRVSDQNKFQSSRNSTSTPFDVNSNQIQPNVNPFQTSISKDKSKLSLPLTSMAMSKKSSISTPQVVKNVEELLEGNLQQQQHNSNVKVKSEPSLQSSNASSITTSVSNTQGTVAGFDDNMQYFGELIKNDIKTESSSPSAKSEITTKSSSSSPIAPTINTQHQQSHQQQQKQPQLALQNQQTSHKQKQQQQQLQQQNLQGNQKWQNALSTNITNVTNQQPMNMLNQMSSRTSTMNMNTTQQMTTGMQMQTGNRPTNTNVGQQPLGGNNQHLNQQQMQHQQQQNFSNPANNMPSMNSMNLSSAMNNTTNNPNIMNSMGNNLMNANNPTGNMMSGNVQQPPSLPRINMASPRVQLAHHVITKNPPMVPPVPNYIQNHVAPNTNEKLQDFLKRKRQNPKYPQSMPNQMISSMQNGIPQNSFSYSNEMGFNSNQGSMQSQQNPMGYYPYQMEGGNNPNLMFGNNPPGYYPNKQANRMVQNLMGRQPMNGMYNPMSMNRQGMNQSNIFNMNAKAPPQYTNQGMNSSLINTQHAMMNVNANMQTPNRLSHYQADTNSMGMPGPLGMNTQMGMRNPMNVGNQFPPPLPRSIVQPNSDSSLMNNAGNNQFNYMSNQQQDPSFSAMSQNNGNLNFSHNNMNEVLIMQKRQKFLRLQQQQQQQLLLSQQQSNTNFPNSNFNTLNTDNNMQHMLPHNNSSMNNNMTFSGSQNFMQHKNSLSNNTLQQNTLQQQTSLHQQQRNSQQQQPQQQQSTLLHQQTLDNIGNLANNQDTLLSPTNSLHNNPLGMPMDPDNQSNDDGDDFDTLLDNPPEQFDLINAFSEGL